MPGVRDDLRAQQAERDQTNYCHSNGVKKVANIGAGSGASYSTRVEVFKANSGDDCYTLEITGTGSGSTDMQNWTYKSPAGATLATATWRASDGRLVIRCDNVDYVIGDVGCPGTDGQPDDMSAECPAGTCTRALIGALAHRPRQLVRLIFGNLIPQPMLLVSGTGGALPVLTASSASLR